MKMLTDCSTCSSGFSPRLHPTLPGFLPPSTTIASVGRSALTDLRARIDRQLGRAIERSNVGRLRTRAGRIAEVEDRQRHREVVASLPRQAGLLVLLHAHLERIDEARHVRQSLFARDEVEI